MTGNVEIKNRCRGIYRIREASKGALGTVLGAQTPQKLRDSAPTVVSTAIYALGKASELKKEVSKIVVEVSEALAHKTAREGLFGEDKGKGYCGTNVEYISEDAIELKYINFDITGFDNKQVKSYIKDVKTRKNCGKSEKNTAVLRVFNGF